MRRNKIFISALICAVVSALTAAACSVPVFRYALERWPADSYTLVVAHKGALSEQDQSALDAVVKETYDGDGFANIYVANLDYLADTNSEALKHLPEDLPETPHLYLFYPRSVGEPKIIWDGPFTKKNTDLIISSEKRKEIAAEILRGRSVTWLLLESGNTKADAEAYDVLKEVIKELETEIIVPGGIVTAEGDVTGMDTNSPDANMMDTMDPENKLHSGIPLQISFSRSRMTRDQEGEDVFLAMLLNMEKGLLESKDEPMLFPFFGRGRALEPLLGEGIHAENIAGMSYYLCGACSCQVKGQNPGLDFVFTEDWDTWLADSSAFEEKELPPLSGVADIIAEPVPESSMEIIEKDQSPPDIAKAASAIKRGVIILIIIVGLAVVAGTVMIAGRKE